MQSEPEREVAGDTRESISMADRFTWSLDFRGMT